MSTEATTRVSVRLKTDVYSAILKRSEQSGIDPSTFIQRALERAVYEDLPQERRDELDRMEALFTLAQDRARELRRAGGFTQDFTLHVFRALMQDPASRKLYEAVIEADAYTDGAPKKSPTNMYLGWYIKNAVNAEPLLDDTGKPRRAFVKGEPIKSYTLLRDPNNPSPTTES